MAVEAFVAVAFALASPLIVACNAVVVALMLSFEFFEKKGRQALVWNKKRPAKTQAKKRRRRREVETADLVDIRTS